MNQIDKIFAEKLKDAQIAPRPEAWKRIEQGLFLQKAEKTNHHLKKWILIVFLLGTVVGSIGWWYVQSDATRKGIAINTKDTTEKTTQNSYKKPDNSINTNEKNLQSEGENIKQATNTKSNLQASESQVKQKIQQENLKNSKNLQRIDSIDTINHQTPLNENNSKKEDVSHSPAQNKQTQDHQTEEPEENLAIKVRIKLSKPALEAPKPKEQEARAQDYGETKVEKFIKKAKKIKSGEETLKFKIFGVSSEKLFSTENL